MRCRRSLAAVASAVLVLPTMLSTPAVAATNQVLRAPSNANWTGTGGAGHDFVGGRLGNDTVSGGGGSDLVVGEHADAWFGPGAINDIITDVRDGHVTNGYIDLEESQIETLLDHLWVEGFSKAGGNDRVIGGTGADILAGGNGHDEVCGRPDDIAVYGGGGTDVPCPVFTGLISTASGSGNLKAGMRDLDDAQYEVDEDGNHNPYAFVLPGRTPVSSAGGVDTYRTAKAIVKLNRSTGAVNVSARPGAAGVEQVKYTVRRRVVHCADYSAFDLQAVFQPGCEDTGGPAPAPAFLQARAVNFRIGIPPDTTITQGAKRWELRKRPAFGFGSDDPAATFQCSYDGAAFAGCASGYRPPFAAGTHVLRVRARNAVGVDPSPASRKWTHPHDDRQLSATPGWRRVTGQGYYLRTASVTTTRGQVLRRGNVRARSLVLVATRCPGCGTVKVFYGTRLLKQVSLDAASTRHRQVIPIASWSSRQSAKTVRIKVVSSGRTVVIDGLGIATS